MIFILSILPVLGTISKKQCRLNCTELKNCDVKRKPHIVTMQMCEQDCWTLLTKSAFFCIGCCVLSIQNENMKNNWYFVTFAHPSVFLSSHEKISLHTIIILDKDSFLQSLKAWLLVLSFVFAHVRDDSLCFNSIDGDDLWHIDRHN